MEQEFFDRCMEPILTQPLISRNNSDLENKKNYMGLILTQPPISRTNFDLENKKQYGAYTNPATD